MTPFPGISGQASAHDVVANPKVKSAPFQVNLLPPSEGYLHHEDLFGASYGSAFGSDGIDLLPPDPACLRTCISKELSLSRLEKHEESLWFAGLPLPPRPLHAQRLLCREIIVTEQFDLHLVWTGERMFIKPLCRFLLEPGVWDEHLTCPENWHQYPNTGNCDSCKARRIAMGFLYSYTSLIRYESDFHIAIEKKLLPSGCRWVDWKKLAREVLTKNIYDDVDKRFIYGELRLSRLNMLHFLRTRKLYWQIWSSYTDFFSDNFQWMALSTVFIAVILNAFQVGDMTALAENSDFKKACYITVLMSLFFPLVAGALVFAIFAITYARSWIATIKIRDARFEEIGRSKE